MRFFNTAGPTIPEDHYHIPLLERFDLPEIMELIDRKRSWDEKVFRREETEGGEPVTVWGM